MRIGDLIFNLDGQPFQKLELAERMQRLLIGETGNQYYLETTPNAGYVLRRAEATGETRAERVSTAPKHEREPHPTVDSTPTPTPPSKPVEIKAIVYRPAVFRANIMRLPFLLAAIALLVLPQPLVLATLNVAHINLDALWISRLVTGLMLAGGCLAIGIAITLWTEWVSSAYTVSASGVEARVGLFARDLVGLRYEDIRSVTLKQSFFERLVGIGTLEFASAGTQDRPVRFLDISRPAKVKRIIEARMRQASQD